MSPATTEPIWWCGPRFAGRVRVRRSASHDRNALLRGARIGRCVARQDGLPVEAEVAGLLGDFAIVRVIGRGGMGVVYEAVQKSLNRRVVLEILPTASAGDPRKVKRFLIQRKRPRVCSILTSCRSIWSRRKTGCTITRCNSSTGERWRRSSR